MRRWYNGLVSRSTGTAIGFGQSWKRTLLEVGVLLLALVGLFLAARGIVGCVADAAATQLPVSVDAKIGEAGAESMRAKYNLGDKPTQAQLERCQRVFDELQGALSQEEKDILQNPRLTVVVDEQVNAFALPGGEVFVLTGLLDRVKDDDDMLRGVLAHELGHAIKRHGVRGLARRAAFGVVLAMILGQVDDMVVTLAAGASQLDGLAHSREMETEADIFGADLLTRSGHDVEGLARFLESLGSQPVPELLSTHPNPVERAAEIRARARGD